VQADPIGQDSGTNIYAYADGNPVQHSDPTGEVVIVPIAINFGRCMLECIATIALLDDCFDFGDASADCAIECLNPLYWFTK
jgi:hypothetical protein